MSINAIKATISKHPAAFIYVKDEQCRYIEGNDNILSFLGFTHIEQLFGKTDYDLFSECFAKQYVQHDQATIAAGKLCVIEASLTQHGDIVLMSSQKYRFFEEETQQSGVVGISMILNDGLIQSFISMFEYGDHNELNATDSLFSIRVNQYASKPLTKNELDVLYFILRGLTQKQIADALDLSSRTIEDYVNRIKTILKCLNKAQLFNFAFHYELLKIVSSDNAVFF